MRLGKIRFEPEISEDQIGPGSVDLTLSSRFWRLKEWVKLIDLAEMGFEDVVEEFVAEEVILPPHGLIIGMTREKVYIDEDLCGWLEGRSRYARVYIDEDLCGWLEGRSRYARMGLAIHSASGFIQPGSYNHQVLEISNLTPYPMKLKAGMRIVQVIFELSRSRTTKPYRVHGAVAKDQ